MPAKYDARAKRPNFKILKKIVNTHMNSTFDLDRLMDAVKASRGADITGAKKLTDDEIREFLVGGNHGDERDAMRWGDIVRESKRRNLGIKPDDSKYDFF